MDWSLRSPTSRSQTGVGEGRVQSIARKYAEDCQHGAGTPLVLDEDLKVISANDSFRKVFRVSKMRL